jgi:hypothetical protein
MRIPFSIPSEGICLGSRCVKRAPGPARIASRTYDECKTHPHILARLGTAQLTFPSPLAYLLQALRALSTYWSIMQAR